MPECGCFHGDQLTQVGPGEFHLTIQVEGGVALLPIFERAGVAASVEENVAWFDTTYSFKGVADEAKLAGFIQFLSSRIIVNLDPLTECYAFGPYTVFDENQAIKTTIGSAINRVKYWRDASLVPRLSAPLAQFIGRHPTLNALQVIACPPSSSGSGGGLASGLAREISVARNLDLISITKSRETEQQKILDEGLAESEVVNRIANSMTVSVDITAKDVLLVDDTIRSGGTMTEAARALLAAGAQRVYGLSLAKDAKYTNGGIELSEERWKWCSPNK